MKGECYNPYLSLIKIEALMDSGISIDTNTLVLIGAGALILYILLKIASKLLKLIGIFLVIALGYFFWNGGTAEELKGMGVQALLREPDVTRLVEAYCSGDQSSSLKCDCLARPIQEDLTSRLSPEELQALTANKGARIRQIRQSFRNKGEEIRSCMVKEKGGEAWDRIKGALKSASENLNKGGE